MIASYLEDNLVALGLPDCAVVGQGGSVQDYLQDLLKDVPTIEHDLPFEAVASFQPDLLIMDSASMVEGNKYSQYEKIAPTYVIGNEVNNDWREELKKVGKSLAWRRKCKRRSIDTSRRQRRPRRKSSNRSAVNLLQQYGLLAANCSLLARRCPAEPLCTATWDLRYRTW